MVVVIVRINFANLIGGKIEDIGRHELESPLSLFFQIKGLLVNEPLLMPKDWLHEAQESLDWFDQNPMVGTISTAFNTVTNIRAGNQFRCSACSMAIVILNIGVIGNKVVISSPIFV